MFNVGEVGEGYPKQHWVTTQNLCFHPAKYGTRVCLPFWAPFWCLEERNFWQSAKPSLQICRLPFTVRAAPAYLFNVYVRKVSQAPQTITLPKAYLVCEIFMPLVNGSSVAKMFVWCSVWQPLNRRGCHLCPLLSPTSLPPHPICPHWSNRGHTESYTALYGPRCDGTGPDMSLWGVWWGTERRRLACVEVSISLVSRSLLGGSHPKPSRTLPVKLQPKGAASCRRSIVGFEEWAADSR